MAENRGEIPLAEICQTLDIPENEVEDFLIDAIKTRLVRAKISQVKKGLKSKFICIVNCTYTYYIYCTNSFNFASHFAIPLFCPLPIFKSLILLSFYPL